LALRIIDRTTKVLILEEAALFAAVSKDNTLHKALVPHCILRDAVLRTAPQDEVTGSRDCADRLRRGIEWRKQKETPRWQ
jgi:hypothetical protein